MESIIVGLIIIITLIILGVMIYPFFSNQQQKEYNAADLICEIRGNTAFCLHGDIVACYTLNCPPQFSLSETQLDCIQTAWQHTLDSLAEGTIVLKSDRYDKGKFDSSTMPEQWYIQRDCKQYYATVDHLQHQGYLFLVFTKFRSLKDDMIANPFNPTSSKAVKEEDADFQNFVNGVEMAIAMLNESKFISAEPMSREQIVDYSDFYFNGFQSEYRTDLYATKNHIQADGKYVAAITIDHERAFPESITNVCDSGLTGSEAATPFYQGYMDNVGLRLDTSHIYNQIIVMDSHRRHVEQIQIQQDILHKERNWNSANKRGAEELHKYLEQVAGDDNFHYIRGNSNIIFWNNTEAELKKTKERIIGVLRNKYFKAAIPTGEELRNIIYCSHFANVSCMRRAAHYLVDLRHAICLFINTSTYKDDKQGVYLCERLYNTPIKYDIWDSNKKYVNSRNILIKAATGSGKSVLEEHIIRQFAEEDIIPIIIDLGRSFAKMVRLFPEDWVINYTYDPQKPLGLNPFQIEMGTQPSQEKIEDLCAFVWTLVRKGEAVQQHEKTALREILSNYYLTGDDYSWPGFYNWLKINADSIMTECQLTEDLFNIREFLHGGSDFVTGIYSNLFAKADDVSDQFIGKKIILFELDNVKDNSIILSVILHVISAVEDRLIWANRSQKVFKLYEEFAQQLTNPLIFDTVLYQAQAIRKYNGAIGIVLQNLYQLSGNASDKGKTENEAAKALLANFETVIFCPDKIYQDYDAFKPLTDFDKQQILSLKTSFNTSPSYSEFYIKRTRGSNVFRLSIGRNTWLAYQTEGRECDTLEVLYTQTGSMERAIEIYNKIEPYYKSINLQDTTIQSAIQVAWQQYEDKINRI